MPKNLPLLVHLMHDFLQKAPVFSSFPITLSLIGFEELMDLKAFVCPCRHDLNTWLTISIFFCPPFFIFALMYFVLRPFKHDWFHCSQRKNDTRQNWPKALAHCLITSLMWVIILLLDGDYIACAMTDWKGVYVFDVELNRSWCKPNGDIQYVSQLRDLNRQYIHRSQISGYFASFILSLIIITSMVIYDCHTSGKCDFCPKCCRPTAGIQTEEQEFPCVCPVCSATMGQELQGPGRSATMGQELQGPWRSATMGQELQGPGRSATMGHELQGSRHSTTMGQGLQGLVSSATMGQELQWSGSFATMGQELQGLELQSLRDSATMGQELQGLVSSATMGQQGSMSSASMRHKQQGAEGFAAAAWQLDSSDIVQKEKKELGRSALAGHGQRMSGSSAPMGSTSKTPEQQMLLSST